MQLIGGGLIGLGLLALIAAAVVTPQFALAHISPDGDIGPKGLAGLRALRIVMALAGSVLCAIGAWGAARPAAFVALKQRALAAQAHARDSAPVQSLSNMPVLRDLPLATLAAAAAVFIALWALNALLLGLGTWPGTDWSFPMGIVRGPRLVLAGLPYSLAFVLLLVTLTRRSSAPSPSLAIAFGIAFWLLGNLAQGSYDMAFLYPFRNGEIEYFHDAIHVTDWRRWLARFNTDQPSLLTHTQTHPPFAVLLHVAGLSLGGIDAMAWFIVGLSAISIPMAFALFRECEMPTEHACWLTLVFSVVPSVNVHAIACFDAVILATSVAWCWAMVRLGRRGFDPLAFVVGTAAVVSFNTLSFGGTFALLVSALFGLHQLYTRRRWAPAVLAAVIVVTLALCMAFWLNTWGYDHWHAFRTAARLENPDGFRLLHNPLEYVMTRLEDVGEIALFASLPVLAVCLRARTSAQLDLRWSDPRLAISAIGLGSLLLMFLVGAYRTGETARAALFIVPFFLLLLIRAPSHVLRALFAGAGTQALLMQTIANFWY